MSTRRKVGLVGLGVGRGHLEEGYLSQPDLFEVALVCDLDPARLDAVRAEHGIPGTTQFAEMLARPDIEIVDLCTPPALHLSQCIAALEAGKHVICEKPLVGSLAELSALIEAEKSARGVLMPIFQYRWGEAAEQARAIVDAGIAGRPVIGTVETFWTREAEYYAVPWRGKWTSELGGTMTTHTIHLVDLLTRLMGPVASVFGRRATRIHEIEVEDTACAALQLQSGALATISATVNSRDEFTRLCLVFENVTFESGRLPYSPGDGPWRITSRDAATAQAIETVLAGMPPFPGRRFAGQLRDFHAALAAGAPPPVTTRDAHAALSFLTAFYHSSETGTDVPLPLAADHPAWPGWAPRLAG